MVQQLNLDLIKNHLKTILGWVVAAIVALLVSKNHYKLVWNDKLYKIKFVVHWILTVNLY